MSQTITQTETVPPTTTKKRKSKHQLVPELQDTPSKKHRKNAPVKTHTGTEKEKRKDKDKGKAKQEPDGEFCVVSTLVTLSLPPLFSKNPQNGVEQMLDSMVMRYIPALKGVVISHSNIQFVGGKAQIIGDCPNAIVDVKFDAMVWSPRIRMKLSGVVNVCSPDHIAMLVHRTFNVSIPRHHIPTEEYEFEHGPAENDPEFGAGAANGEEVTDEHPESGGRWVHKITREPLGGKSGRVEFTVIGLMVANEMLSLSGSLLDDPFDPRHVPQLSIHHTKTTQPSSDVEDEIEEDGDGDLDDDALKDDGDEIESSSEEEIAAPVRRKVSVNNEEKRKREGGESISTKKEKKRRKL